MKYLDKTAESAPSDPARRNGLIAAAGITLAILVLFELALQFALRAGWKSYRGFDTISAVAIDGKGQTWVSGFWREHPGLMIYSETGETVEVPLPSDLGWGGINALMIDRQDRMWLGTEGGRIAMLDSNGQWIVYSGDTEESVWQIVMDVQGQVWARSHRGPAKIDPNSVDRTFSFLNSGMENSDAVALAIDPQGQVWALTRQRELRVLEANGNWRTVVIVPATVRNGFVDAFLAFDPQGQIWLATVQGVGVLSPDGTWKEHPLGDTSRPLSLYDVIADAEGRIWVAAFQPRSSRAQAFSGLFLFDPQTGWTNYSTRNSGIANDSTALAFNPQGQVWIGSAHGTVSRFDPATSLPVNILPTVRFGTRALVPGILISIALLAVVATMRVQSGMGNTWQTFKFSLGFVAWYVIAAFVWVFLRFSYQQSSVGLLVINPLIVLAPVVHIVFMILLYVKERQMARGALSAMAVNSIAMMLMTPLSAGSLGSSLFGALFMIPFFLLP